MKRMYKVLIPLLAVLALFSGCCLQHEWQAATCTDPETCLKCGKTQGEPLGHQWLPATCTSPETCSRCGLTQGEPLEHTPGEKELSSVAVHDGIAVYETHCTECGQSVDRSEVKLDSFLTDGVFLFNAEELGQELENVAKAAYPNADVKSTTKMEENSVYDSKTGELVGTAPLLETRVFRDETILFEISYLKEGSEELTAESRSINGLSLYLYGNDWDCCNSMLSTILTINPMLKNSPKEDTMQVVEMLMYITSDCFQAAADGEDYFNGFSMLGLSYTIVRGAQDDYCILVIQPDP